jgi:protein ImuB
MTRFVSIQLPFWATDRLGWAPDRRAALLTKEGTTLLLAGVTLAAARAGLRSGQRLADALAAFPDLPVEAFDTEATGQALTRLAARCRRWSPLTAPDGEGALLLDVTGVAGLFGGEEGLMADIAAAFTGFNLHHRIALADTPGAAWAWAGFGAGGILPVGSLRQMLAPLPVAALRLPPEILAGLHRLGLRQIGALLDQPRAPLANRFGREIVARLDTVLGRVPQPVRWQVPTVAYRERTPFVEPIGTRESVEAALTHLLARLIARLTAAGLGVRRLVFTLERVDGSRQDFTIGTAQAERDPRVLARLFREPLDGLDPGFGIEAARLEATETAEFLRRQSDLDGRAAACDRLAPLLDRLRQRLGENSVYRLHPQQSHWPEAAVRRADPLAPVPSFTETPPPRPMQLYAPPHPIEGDGTGYFVWRNRRHSIRHAEGPERIAAEWWRTPNLPARDYWRVEDTAGGRYWLFQSRPQDRPGPWFLHGVFP